MESLITPRGSLREKDYWSSIPLKGYYSKNKYVCKHYLLIVIVNVKGELKHKRGDFRGIGDYKVDFLGEY
jgi:hypothetical protein